MDTHTHTSSIKGIVKVSLLCRLQSEIALIDSSPLQHTIPTKILSSSLRVMGRPYFYLRFLTTLSSHKKCFRICDGVKINNYWPAPPRTTNGRLIRKDERLAWTMNFWDHREMEFRLDRDRERKSSHLPEHP